MAEGKDVVEELEKEITCAICHDHYTEPKVLPCCHYYCKQCLYSLALKAGLDGPFSCPECRNSTTLPQRSADNLPSAFIVNRLKDMHSKLERAHGKVEAKCEMCVEGGKAEAFCRQCVHFICAECVNQHRKIKMFVHHKIASFNELKEGGTKGMVAPAEPSLQTCTVHEQPMNIYCFDCKTLICRDCTIKTHNSQTHNYDFIKVAAPQMKKELIQQLDPLKEAKETLSHAVKEVQTTKSEVEVQGKSVKQHIHSSFGEIVKIVEHRKQELLAEASEITAHKLINLSSQEERLSTTCAVVQSVIEYAKQCVEHLADDDVMRMHAELQSQIKRQIEEQHKQVKNLKPVEVIDMGVEVSNVTVLKQFCQDNAIIRRLIDPAKCLLTGENMDLAEVNEVSTITVTPKLFNGQPPAPSQICTVDAQLKSLVEGSTAICKVNQTQVDKHHIQYTPTVRGRHELTVTVNGQEVAGSPFPVHVSIHPTQLGEPVRVITTQRQCPSDVAVSSSGDVVVAFNNNIVIYGKSGRKLKNFNVSHVFSQLWGVTIDRKNDYVFAVGNTEPKSHKIVKLSPDLELVNEVSMDGTINFTGLTVVGDEVMMCNSNDGCIKVYTTELKYVRQIGSGGDGPGQFSDPRGLSSDVHGNLYISDRVKCSILIFSSGGEFLRSVGGKFKFPFGVCVSGQYVFVADNNSSNVIVYTTEGQYVTSFGQKSKKIGDFRDPWGVCVDMDGFVYVCDHSNNRLQVF